MYQYKAKPYSHPAVLEFVACAVAVSETSVNADKLAMEACCGQGVVGRGWNLAASAHARSDLLFLKPDCLCSFLGRGQDRYQADFLGGGVAGGKQEGES